MRAEITSTLSSEIVLDKVAVGVGSGFSTAGAASAEREMGKENKKILMTLAVLREGSQQGLDSRSHGWIRQRGP